MESSSSAAFRVGELLLLFRAGLLASADALQGDYAAFEIVDESSPIHTVVLYQAVGFRSAAFVPVGRRLLAKEE